MKLNEKQFSMAVSVISSDMNRHLMLSLYKDNAKKYKEIRVIVEKHKNSPHMTSAKTAYYIHQLKKNKIIRKDIGTSFYYLTRFGIQLCELINDTQKICMEYDMDDVGADGKIMVMVQR